MATGSASGVGTGSATVSGTVNPNGAATTYHFDYGTSTSYGSQAPAPPDPSAGSGTTAQTESTALTGLSPNTVYHYRIQATNSSGTSYGGDQTFTTTGTGTSPIPIVATGAAINIGTFGPGTATVTGTVNANGEAATYRFDYGASTNYTSQTISEPISSTTASWWTRVDRSEPEHRLPLPDRSNGRVGNELWGGSDLHDRWLNVSPPSAAGGPKATLSHIRPATRASLPLAQRWTNHRLLRPEQTSAPSPLRARRHRGRIPTRGAAAAGRVLVP